MTISPTLDSEVAMTTGMLLCDCVLLTFQCVPRRQHSLTAISKILVGSCSPHLRLWFHKCINGRTIEAV